MSEAAFDFGPAPTPDHWEQRGYDRACREIVVWLRLQNNDAYPPPDDQSRGAWNAYSGAATCIERGDHKLSTPSPTPGER